VEPILSDLCCKVKKLPFPFPTAYLCEAGSSTLSMVKARYRNQL